MEDFRTEYEGQKNNKKVSTASVILTVFSIFALVLSSVALYQVNSINKKDSQINVQSGSTGQINPSNVSNNGVVNVASQMKDKVVSIATYGKSSNMAAINYTQIGTGSGFIVTKNGYVVTNNHVIANGMSYKVNMGEGRQYDAELVGSDSASDLAVLKIKSNEEFSPVTMGDSDKLQVGEVAIAIGSPLGEQLNNSVTVGYISAKDRDIIGSGISTKMLQTDAAINPGNSGGPLLNIEGTVVGINTMKSTFAGYDEQGNKVSADGIGFAIPVSYAMPIIDEIISNGSYKRAGIGISFVPIDEETSKKSNISQGLLVGEVFNDGPGKKAGIEVNDIIVAVEGQEIKTYKPLAEMLEKKKVGDVITIKLIRAGKEMEVKVTLEDLNAIQKKQEEYNAQKESSKNNGSGQNAWPWPFE